MPKAPKLGKTRPEMRRTQVFLPPSMIDQLKAEAEEKGVSYAEIVRRAVDDHFVMVRLSREAEEMTASMLAEVEEAAAEWDENGETSPSLQVATYQAVMQLRGQVQQLTDKLTVLEKSIRS